VWHTNNLTLYITNLVWPSKATFTFFNDTTTTYSFECASNENGGILFGSGVTGWTPTTNYSDGVVIGMSNNYARAIGFAPGGGAEW
jgi:hypothetical protein